MDEESGIPLRLALADLDLDAPVLAIYLIPRLLLAPPPSDLLRGNLTKLLRTRAATLLAGGASILFTAFDWLAATPTPLDFTV